jgi:holo-[acyl-carrier protein] synthase
MNYIASDLSSSLRCGTDLVDIAHFERALDATNGRMRSVCFTTRELRDSSGRAERLAARWAVKESVSKVLGVGLLRGIGFHDIEVTTTDEGTPSITLHGPAERQAVKLGLTEWAVSATHEYGVAMAFVVASRHPLPHLDSPD